MLAQKERIPADNYCMPGLIAGKSCESSRRDAHKPGINRLQLIPSEHGRRDLAEVGSIQLQIQGIISTTVFTGGLTNLSRVNQFADNRLVFAMAMAMAMAMASSSLMEKSEEINGHVVPAAAAAAAMEMVTFSAIMDDIIFPDGRASIACLGGGGPQTAFGALLWCSNGERVGLAGGVGADFPEDCKKWLEKAGVDIGGLVPWPCPTPRVWHLSEPLDGSIQILEDDHVQAEIQRLSRVNPSWEMLLPELNLLPPLYQKAKTYHAAVHPSGLDIDFLRTLRSGAEILSVEVFGPAEDVVPHSELQALVSTGHIFSPNEREAASLVGAGTPLELIERLSKLGAEIVVLRRGHLGCIVHRLDTKETWDVPAFHTLFSVRSEENGDMHMTKLQKASLDVKPIVDPTGCGNSFCGAFLVGWYKTRNLLTAALWGSVSASFMLEYEGLPPPLVSEWRTVAQRRLRLLQPHVQRISVP